MTVNLPSYSGLLDRLGIANVVDGIWVRVGNPAITQGWKLHLSSTPKLAPGLIAAVGPVFARSKVSFKVARDADVLERLNAGRLGGTQIGKFITAYPNPEIARALAIELRSTTECFEGPEVRTDMRLGEILYSRYGAFAPIRIRDRLGVMKVKIEQPNGVLQDDEYRIPYEKPDGIIDPFEGLVRSGKQRPAAKLLLDFGYVLTGVVHSRAKGSVFLALCVRTREELGVRIIKQGRRLCLSDSYGRDSRWRLERELKILRDIESTGSGARAFEYFEADDDGYLVLEFLAGRDIEAECEAIRRKRCWSDLSIDERLRLLDCMICLIDVVSAIHERGFIHRDISAKNVWVSEDGRVKILDFEMAQSVDDHSPVVGSGTPGFASPQQMAGSAAEFSDDIYSVACVLVLALTGMDPRRLLFADGSRRQEQLFSLTGGGEEARPLVAVAARALDPSAHHRPELVEIKTAVSHAIMGLRAHGVIHSASRSRNRESSFVPLLTAAVRGLEIAPRDAHGLFQSFPLGLDDENSTEDDLTLLRSAFRGVAGVGYVISRALRFGFSDGDSGASLLKIASYLRRRDPAPDLGMPGLYFGEAGVAVALREIEQVLPELKITPEELRKYLDAPIDWADLTHGAAGQGIAALCCGDEEVARHCVEYLVSAQERDGSWTVGPGSPPLSGQKLTGFAHGVAGIVYFLLAFAGRFPGTTADRAWREGLGRLSSRSEREGDAIVWPYSDVQQSRWMWWCHGSPGIALTYLKAYETTRNEALMNVALDALNVHPARVRHNNLGQCHGLSGLGEIYLEAFRVTRDGKWRDRALEIAQALQALARWSELGEATWIPEHSRIFTGDLGTGNAGIAHFLLRLCAGPDEVGFPLLS